MALRPVHVRLPGRLKRSTKLFADETTAPALDPGRGCTNKGQLCARDERPWGRSRPPPRAFPHTHHGRRPKTSRVETTGRGTCWAVPRAQLWGFGRGRAAAEVGGAVGERGRWRCSPSTMRFSGVGAGAWPRLLRDECSIGASAAVADRKAAGRANGFSRRWLPQKGHSRGYWEDAEQSERPLHVGWQGR
jgi:hypothetical protein